MTRHHPHKQTPPLTPLRRVWLLFALTGLGCCVGVLALLYGAAAYVKLPGLALFQSYFHHPALLGLNLLPPVLLIWLFYFLTRRGWGAFLGSFLPCVAVAMVNYFKIRLRSDPFLAADLRLVSEAGGIVGNYSLDVDWLTWLTLGALVAGLLFSALLIPKWPRRGWVRAFAAASCAALCAVSCASLFTDQDLYQATDNSEYINPWSDVEVFVSKGCLYPFLYSMRDMFPAPPPGYDAQAAQAMLAEFTDEDIPADKQVSVMGIMLEAFCDLTDFDFMASQPAEVVSLGNTCETGVDVAGGIVCRNAEQQLGVVSLTLHSKQPKRSVISFDKCYIEVNDYPRADHATIVWTADGRREEVHAGTEAYALCYEMADLEKAVAGDDSKRELLDYASDVMELMTKLRADWGVLYPEEE